MGKLADGTVISVSSHLDASYHWPFYKALYGNKGSLAGVVGFDDSQADSDLLGSDLLWLRPVTTGKYYATGWSTGLQLDLLGAKYVKTAGVSILPNLGAADPVAGNATLTFSDGKLPPTPLTKTLNVAVNDAVTNAPTTDKSFTLKLHPRQSPGQPPAHRHLPAHRQHQAGLQRCRLPEGRQCRRLRLLPEHGPGYRRRFRRIRRLHPPGEIARIRKQLIGERMKISRPLAISMLCNVGLIATLAGLAGRSPHALRVKAIAEGERTGPAVAQAASIPFRWSQIESEDYQQYAANLRAVGCPEHTIETIVGSELVDVFARERAELRQHELSSSNPSPSPTTTGQKLQELESEQKRFLGGVLPGLSTPSTERLNDLVQRTEQAMSTLREPAINGLGMIATNSDSAASNVVQNTETDHTSHTGNPDSGSIQPANLPVKRRARRDLFTPNSNVSGPCGVGVASTTSRFPISD